MRLFFPVASVVLCLLLSGCALFRPYHMQIEQGVAIKPAQVSELKVGMTQEQVTYLLGTPNLKDPYHPNTWYYIYTNEENYQPMSNHQLIVNFDANGNVSNFQEKDHAPKK